MSMLKACQRNGSDGLKNDIHTEGPVTATAHEYG